MIIFHKLVIEGEISHTLTKKFRLELSSESSSAYVGDKYWPNGRGLIQPDNSEDT